MALSNALKLKKLPRLEEELDAFAADLEDIRKDQPLMATGEFMGVILDTSVLIEAERRKFDRIDGLKIGMLTF